MFIDKMGILKAVVIGGFPNIGKDSLAQAFVPIQYHQIGDQLVFIHLLDSP